MSMFYVHVLSFVAELLSSRQASKAIWWTFVSAHATPDRQ
jgi:hypothetical protein